MRHDSAAGSGDADTFSPDYHRNHYRAARSFAFEPTSKEPDLEVTNLLLTGKSTSDADSNPRQIQAGVKLVF